jgi:hypothetical protein
MFQRIFGSYSTQPNDQKQVVSTIEASINTQNENNQDGKKEQEREIQRNTNNQTKMKGINEQLILQLYQQVDTLQKDLQHAKSSYQHVYEQYTKCQKQQQHTIQTQVEQQVQQHAQYVERLEKQTIQQEKHIEHLQKILHDLQCTR